MTTAQPSPTEPTGSRRPQTPSVATNVRTAAVWQVLSQAADELQTTLRRSLRVLDLGGGTGGMAVPLAVAGHHVTVVDPSPDALASLARRAAEADVADSVRALQGDADALTMLLGDERVDLITCHGTLEHVDDPALAIGQLAEVLQPGGVLSLVATQRFSSVFARALAGDFAAALQALMSDDGTWGDADPMPRRFDRQALIAMVSDAGLHARTVHGVRIFSDLVPSSALDNDTARAQLLALEHAAADRPGLCEMATAIHVLAAAHG